MAWARSIKTGSVGRKAVLYVLANHATSEGVVYDCPQTAIADEAELSERQVRTHLSDMEKSGVIARERRPGKGTGRQHDIIRLRMAELPLILGAKRNRQPEVISAFVQVQPEISSGDEATGSQRRLRQPELSSACLSPNGLLSLQPEMFAASQGQPATGNRKYSPLAGQPEAIPAQSNNNLRDNTPLKENPPKGGQKKAPPTPGQPAPGEGTRAVEIYNDAARRWGWVAARGPHSAARQAAVKARLREHGLSGWTEAIVIASQSAFLAGENDRGWRISLDWLTQPKNFTKVIEGSYAKTRDGDAKPKEDDGFAFFRAACRFRISNNQWPSHYPRTDQPFSPDDVPEKVRSEFAQLFQAQGAAA